MRPLLAKRLLAFVWLAACLSVLAVASTRFESSDLDRTFFPIMFCLTFPAGILAAVVGLVFYFALSHFVVLHRSEVYFYVLMWVAMVGAGYWQWFVALPRFFRKRRD